MNQSINSGSAKIRRVVNSKPASNSPTISILSGLRHFILTKAAENLSGQRKQVDDLKTPETFVTARFMPIRAKSLSMSGFEAIFASVFV
ncbi:hypothetical protein QUB70_18300 [Microcoleus sp. A003_D6]|uniref:hypothetical protein n=1 Tax=Microcoleus sp. A003_D6 TaxID=3055266 RepID=UPI002FD3F4C0